MSSSSGLLKYRPDIDGLRTIAVLFVVIYHAYPQLLPSGFIGVDIFFVISGFLITSIIYNEILKNNFSILTFYKKRVRRIFPALLTVLTTSLLLGFFILSEKGFKSLGKHTISSIAFISNISLYKELGYFDSSSDSKPLLHLWSLGVEEQFYFIWPILLWFLAKNKKFLRFSLILLLLTSFTFGVYAKNLTSTNFGFYLLPTRFWEMLSGAILAIELAHIEDFLSNNKISYNLPIIFSLIFLLPSIFFITAAVPYPSYWAALPVCFSLAILCAENSYANKYILSSRTMISLGKISYPLYLWHWPMLVFGRMLHINTLIILLASISISYLTYFYIEKPIQLHFKELSLKTFAQKLIYKFGIVLILLLISTSLLIRRGYIFSFENYKYPELATVSKYIEYDITHTRISKCFLDSSLHFSKFDTNCYESNRSKKIFILGDSHAAHLYQAMPNVLNSIDTFIGQLNISSCPPFYDSLNKKLSQSCTDENRAVKKILSNSIIDRVILFADWVGTSEQIPSWKSNLEKTILFLKDRNIKSIYLIGPFPISDKNLSSVAIDSIKASKGIPTKYQTTYYKNVKNIDLVMNDFALKYKINYVSLFKLLCNNNSCEFTTPRKELISYDTGHLTFSGSEYVLQKNIDIVKF